MVRKILLYGDLDLNVIDGSSIWLVNLAKLLLEDKDNYVDVLLKKRIRNHILVGEIEKRYRIRLLYVKDYIDHITEVDRGNIVKVLETVDGLRDYSCMIIRGTPVMEQVAFSGLIGKVIPYLTDFCHDRERMPEEQKRFLKDLYRKVQAYFVQTEAMREYLKDVLEVDGRKFHILYPVVFPGRAEKKEPKTLVYAGKIAKNWNIIELLDIMERLEKEDPQIRLHFMEVSVKLLEYCHSGVPVILRKTRMHAAILGEDYPLFVESEEACVEKILNVFRDPALWEKAEACLMRSAEKFSVPNIYANVKKALSAYPVKNMRLLVSGHDLKFLKPLFPYFESAFSLEVQELEEYMEFSPKEAEKYLKRADIIWCEWLLTSAQWYSVHAYPHQSLFIRAHRFETARKYGNNLDINRVSKVITVSYYWFEEFTRRFRIPAEKCTIVSNFIDTEKYVKEKEPDSRFHLALIGALPKRKGLERAVRLLKMLREKDDRYCLHVPGKRPEEFPNTWNVPEEREYYERVYRMIEEEGLGGSVFFDGWVEMTGFLRRIGYVLSLSDAKFPESFHVTPFEGMASGAVTAALKWEGIEYIYPEEVIMDSISDIAEYIERLNGDPEKYAGAAERGRRFVRGNYDIGPVWEQIRELLEFGGDYEEFCH